VTTISPNDPDATLQATAGHRDAAYDSRARYLHMKDTDRGWWDLQHEAYREAYETTWKRLEDVA
jgi:hypothetical protein